MAKKGFTKNRKKNSANSENRRLFMKLKELSARDPLTGLYNYQYFTDRLDIEIKNAKRFIFPLSLIMIDIDYFKSVNDTYGYHVGNMILKEFAHYIKRFARVTDVIVRYAGAGFIILTLNTNKEGAAAFAQRICEKIQKHAFRVQKNNVKLKVSVGVVNFPEDNIDNVAGLIDAAESAMRDAKDAGGNRVYSYKKPSGDGGGFIASKKGKEEIRNLKIRLKAAGRKLDQALLESIYAFAKAIEARDHYTGEHAEKMVNIVRGVAKELKVQKRDITDLEHAAVLHDLGKIGIDDKILHKKGKLTKGEFEQIKKHPLIGTEILRSIHFLKDVIPLILYHHERYDGKGYAAHLKGEQIPIGARILAIADVYQALISDRPYRKAYSRKEALKIIKDASGKQFDPAVVEAFMKSLKKKW